MAKGHPGDAGQGSIEGSNLDRGCAAARGSCGSADCSSQALSSAVAYRQRTALERCICRDRAGAPGRDACCLSNRVPCLLSPRAIARGMAPLHLRSGKSSVAGSFSRSLRTYLRGDQIRSGKEGESWALGVEARTTRLADRGKPWCGGIVCRDRPIRRLYRSTGGSSCGYRLVRDWSGDRPSRTPDNHRTRGCRGNRWRRYPRRHRCRACRRRSRRRHRSTASSFLAGTGNHVDGRRGRAISRQPAGSYSRAQRLDGERSCELHLHLVCRMVGECAEVSSKAWLVEMLQ